MFVSVTDGSLLQSVPLFPTAITLEGSALGYKLSLLTHTFEGASQAITKCMYSFLFHQISDFSPVMKMGASKSFTLHLSVDKDAMSFCHFLSFTWRGLKKQLCKYSEILTLISTWTPSGVNDIFRNDVLLSWQEKDLCNPLNMYHKTELLKEFSTINVSISS